MDLKSPGVYIQHVPSGLLAVEAAATAVAAFIGPVKRGQLVTDDKEDGQPVFISTQSQYAAQFGTLDGAAGGLRNLVSEPDSFGWAVQSYFLNGGTKAYIVPVAAGDGVAATTVLGDPSDATAGLQFTASSEGVWANGMAIRMSLVLSDADPKKAIYDVVIGLLNDKQKLDPILETHTGLVMDQASGQYLVSKINSASSLVKVAAGPRGSFAGSAVVGVEGTPAAGFDPSSIAAGKTLDVTITGDSGLLSPITITFPGGAATLGDLAAEIETQVRTGTSAPARTGFTAVATPEGSIQILPGRSSNTATVNTVTITGGNVRTALGFNSPTVIGIPPFVTDAANPAVVIMANGTDHGPPGNNDYSKAFEHLRDYRDITIIMLPGKVWTPGGDNGAIDAAVTHAEFMQNRMVLIDPPDPIGNARLQSPKDVKDMGAPNSPYTALYYPWLDVANPFHDPDTAANLPKSFRIPPGPFAAGLWARIDGRRGVWKAPAGLEATVRGALGPNIDIGADLQDNLNEFGVNCLRSIIGPTVVWGARTLATKTQPEFRYVPIRRTQNMIGESLYNALQAVVFEPNDEKLWASLRAGAGAFMDALHRAGAFQPAKASDAYYVRCGLNVTMSQGEIDAGIVRLVVGFAPLKPAEFVVVQIKQIVGQTA
jgi:hypothetical protein